jgi:hypothetical protein
VMKNSLVNVTFLRKYREKLLVLNIIQQITNRILIFSRQIFSNKNLFSGFACSLHLGYEINTFQKDHVCPCPFLYPHVSSQNNAIEFDEICYLRGLC